MIRFLFCGDVMPGGAIPYNPEGYINSELLEYMCSFDVRVGTLECAIGTGLAFEEKKMLKTKSIVYARNEDFFRIKEMGFNVMTLANNHVLDLGKEGLANTLHLMDDANILHCGAGMNLQKARQPAILKIDGISIAFIGCLFKGVAPTLFQIASETEYGVYQTSIEQIEIDIKEVKKDNDVVIVMPHWGEEHCYMPPEYCKDYAKRMIKAGADMIIGSHTHIVNPVVCFGGKTCFFSLGNFLFPDRYLEVPRPTFYPTSSSTINSLKKVWNYPKSVDVPVRSVQKGRNRIGMAAEVEMADGNIISNSYRFVVLDENNILKLLKNSSKILVKRMRLICFGLAIKLPIYHYIRLYYKSRFNYFSKFVHSVSDRLHIVYDVDVRLD